MKKVRLYGLVTVILFIVPFAIAWSESFSGYTLFSPNNSRYTYLADMSNTVVHSWTHTVNGGYSVYLLDNGDIIRSAEANNSVFGGGGAAGKVQEFNWSGTLVWDYTYSSTTYLSHHDIEPLPNGNVLLIAWELKSATQARQAGYQYNAALWPDHIIEVHPTGSNSGTIVWAWHAWDHLIQDYDATKDNYGVVGDHPELLDINMSGGGGPSGGDWMHTNGISYNPQLDQIVMSSHTLNEIYVIDHSTTTAEAAGHTGGNSGMGGDILYRWGCPSNYDAPGSAYFDVVHCSVWIPDGLPGAGHILAYNNREGQSTSIVVELVPPSDSLGHYHIGQDSAFGPSAPIWTYTASGFYSNHLGGCERLPNGNTFIVESTSGYMFEVNTAGVVQWSYARGGEIARALRYSPNLQAPWASVSSPNGSEVWEAGSSHNITWLDFDNFGVTSFKLDYSTDSGSSWLPIQDWIDGEPRTFAWTIPNTPSSSCKVKVYCRDIAGNIGTDSSNSNFTINSSDTEAPSVIVGNPNGGEDWQVGSAHNISWSDYDNIGIASFKLEYSTDSGSNWITIQDWLSGDPHTFLWTVPNTQSTQCKIKISCRDASSNIGEDVSNSNFTISFIDTEAPSVTLSIPNGGEVWDVGSSHNITWSDNDNVGITSYKLEYSTNSGSDWTTIQEWVSSDPHTYSWVVPNAPSALCRVRVSCLDAASNIGMDQSNGDFTIIQVIPPGTISGHVYEQDGITPLSSVIVGTYDNLNALVAVDTSTAAGDYQVSLPPATYHEHFAKGGYTSSDISGILVASDSISLVSISLNQIVGGCTYVIGDANGSATFTGLDVTYSVRYFKGGSHPLYSCECPVGGGNTWYVSGDVNGSCTFSGLDVTYMVRYFKGGAAPICCSGCPPTMTILGDLSQPILEQLK